LVAQDTIRAPKGEDKAVLAAEAEVEEAAAPAEAERAVTAVVVKVMAAAAKVEQAAEAVAVRVMAPEETVLAE